MNAMIQTKVSKKAARRFIEMMSYSGYTFKEEGGHYSFRKNGVVTMSYSVWISPFSRNAFIGVRPD